VQEVARFSDVYQAEVAAAFLASFGVEALVAERIAATMNPVMQTALGGVRLLTPDHQAEIASDLLAAAERGDFAQAERGDTDSRRSGTSVFPVVTLLAGLLMGHGYAGRAYLGDRAGLSALQVAGLWLLVFLILGAGLFLIADVIRV